MLGLFVDAIGLYTRSRERKKTLEKVNERYDFHLKHSPVLRKIIIIKSPKDESAAEIFRMKDSTAIVLFDCSLELSNTENELVRLWNEAKRVTGSKEKYDDLFVIKFQRWSSNRINLDPRIRWIITDCPPDSTELKYEPFGRRNQILAETRFKGKNDQPGFNKEK